MTLACMIVPLPLASSLKDGDRGVECGFILQERFKLLGDVGPGKNTPISSPKEIIKSPVLLWCQNIPL